MTQLYSNLLAQRLKRSLFVFAFILGTTIVSFGQIYKATLSGPAEQPPNTSPGTGSATVTVTGNFMRVQVSFSGLTAGTSASHIHAPTAVPGTGAAGVATTTPTFANFPLGVTSGTYDRTLDMTLASSYNPAYVTANGGVPQAFAALKTALNNGTSYLNVHTTAFPGGEIRGFLVVCPTINVTIPDAFALPQGTVANTVYPAYAPASSLTLTANASGGTGPYSFSWSNGATTASITVSPTVNTQYTVDVQDQRGCPGSASKTVAVMDISGGHNDNKIVICHKGKNTLTIATPAVDNHIAHGDMLGGCGASRDIIGNEIISENNRFAVRVQPNPSGSYFNLQLSGDLTTSVQIRVYDGLGRIVESRSALQPNQTLRLGSSYTPGIYLVEIVQGTEKQTLRLIKTK